MRILIAIWAMLISSAALAQTYDSSHGPLKVEKIVGGLEYPWSFAFLPDGALLITERPGRLRLFDSQLSPPIANLPPIADLRQGGLLDVVLSPDYSETGRIYFSYSAYKDGGAQTRVATAVLNRNTPMRLTDGAVIFQQEPVQRSGVHFGSRIVFADDGSLFITVGDRGQREEAQNTNAHQGSIIRVLPSGAPHPDNPFINGGGRPEIWSYGHRNPQGAVLDDDGDLWTVEHGAMGGDEINRPQSGGNYGWPVISYGRHYNGYRIGEGTEKQGMEQPAFYWDPSIAPSGLTQVTGDMFPNWRGDLLVGALKYRLLSHLTVQDGKITGEERILAGAFGRIRDVRMAPDGAIWFATDSSSGAIYRVTPAH
ncbi:MAG: PQQ-dependent sugar dehydrogenase [Pikeienuella sp.]